MSLLGFDAIGRWALGQLPAKGNAALVAGVGAFTETGETAPMSIASRQGAGTWLVTSVGVSFALRQASVTTGFTFAGVGSGLAFAGAATAGVYGWLGIAAVGSIGEAITGAGRFAATGVMPAMDVSVSSHAGAYSELTFGATLTRDFINWLPEPFAAAAWNAETATASNWSGASRPASSWTDSDPPRGGWAQLAPPRGTWAIESAQAISPPTSD